MPKAKGKIGKKKSQGPSEKPKKGEEAAEAEEAVAGEGPQYVSRGQRKRAARREGFIRKFEFVNSAMRQERAREGGALGDLDSLAEAADQAFQEGGASASEADIGKKKNPMSRRAQALATEREINQYEQVMKVAAFQKDPLGALEQHLKNSIKKQKQDIKDREAKAKLRAKLPVKAPGGKRHLPQQAKQAASHKSVIKTKLKKKGGEKQKKKMEVD
mmetsp:Transcript_729/g.1950  ORF Transcript_729/g.1950 Transcript_729/m.1950 type:complete len:216 (-) Transcript_729:382-1029(-)